MNNKISPKILNMVNTMSGDKEIDCIVYADKNTFQAQIFKNHKYTYFPFINAFSIKLDKTKIFSLSQNNWVNYITQGVKVKTMLNISNKIMNTPSDKIDESFSVAIIDTGIYPHLDIVGGRNRLIEWVDLINNKKRPYDDNGHGTFVAGVLCGSGFISCGKYIGVDPNINIISIKALDYNGETGANSILSAMQWVYDNKKRYNIKVVCMSFGSDPIGTNDPLIKGAEALWDKGIVVVAAGGNSGPKNETIKSPGASSKIITVGALDDERKGEEYEESKFHVADFSSRGPIYNRYKPDILSPGVNITGPSNYKLTQKYYDEMSGTSVSTPMIAAMCCHIIKVNKNYSPDVVKKRIIESGIKIDGQRNKEGYGWFRW